MGWLDRLSNLGIGGARAPSIQSGTVSPGPAPAAPAQPANHVGHGGDSTMAPAGAPASPVAPNAAVRRYPIIEAEMKNARNQNACCGTPSPGGDKEGKTTRGQPYNWTAFESAINSLEVNRQDTKFSRGRSAEEIEKVQKDLNELGALAKPIEVNGKIGPDTKWALLTAQAKLNLEGTGAMDAETLNRLPELVSKVRDSRALNTKFEELKEIAAGRLTPDGAKVTDPEQQKRLRWGGQPTLASLDNGQTWFFRVEVLRGQDTSMIPPNYKGIEIKHQVRTW